MKWTRKEMIATAKDLHRRGPCTKHEGLVCLAYEMALELDKEEPHSSDMIQYEPREDGGAGGC